MRARCTSLARPDVVVRSSQHCRVITCIDVAADGHTLVTGSADTTVVIWTLYGDQYDGGRQPPNADAAPQALHVLGAPACPLRSRPKLARCERVACRAIR